MRNFKRKLKFEAEHSSRAICFPLDEPQNRKRPIPIAVRHGQTLTKCQCWGFGTIYVRLYFESKNKSKLKINYHEFQTTCR